jgi:hypothetical protein
VSRLDVGDDQLKALVRTGLRGATAREGDVLADRDRAPGAGRRELDDANFVGDPAVHVDVEAELVAVELHGAVDVADGQYDYF